jgi:hypothetical protein
MNDARRGGPRLESVTPPTGEEYFVCWRPDVPPPPGTAARLGPFASLHEAVEALLTRARALDWRVLRVVIDERGRQEVWVRGDEVLAEVERHARPPRQMLRDLAFLARLQGFRDRG